MDNYDYKIENRRMKLDIWLRKCRMSRKQFAEELNVSEASAYGWLSNTNIPDKRWDEIEDFFKRKGVVEEPKPICRAIGVVVWEKDAIKMDKIAEERGQTLAEFIRDCAVEETKRILGEA